MGLRDQFSSTYSITGVDVNWLSATFKIVAQNSCNKEAILKLDDFGSGLAGLWPRTVSGYGGVKMVDDVCGSKQLRQEKFFFVAENQDWRQVRSDNTRDKVLSAHAGFLD